MIVAKTDVNLTAEEYQKWHGLYTSMVNSEVLMVDGRFTVYNVDKNENLEEFKDNRAK